MKSKNTIKKQLKQIIKRLEKDRDDLRNLQYEIEMHLDGKDDDISDIERVLDQLSRYV